jgi:hypothetical protein
VAELDADGWRMPITKIRKGGSTKRGTCNPVTAPNTAARTTLVQVTSPAAPNYLFLISLKYKIVNMATLSKMAIENIAEKMTEKSKKYVEATLKEYQTLATEIYETQIPDEVKKCFKNHSQYIETTQTLFLDGHGFNRDSLSMIKQMPSTTSYQQKLNLTAAVADKLIKAKRKWEKAKDDYKHLKEETEAALFALKTNKNIRENLPEAIPYLPPPMSNALVVNFSSLQKKLVKQPELKPVTA